MDFIRLSTVDARNKNVQHEHTNARGCQWIEWPNAFDTINVLVNFDIVFKGMFGRVYRNPRGCWLLLVGVPKVTEVSGAGIEVVPNLTGVFGRLLRLYRTLPKTSVGYSPRKYPRYAAARPLYYRPHPWTISGYPSRSPRGLVANLECHLR